MGAIAIDIYFVSTMEHVTPGSVVWWLAAGCVTAVVCVLLCRFGKLGTSAGAVLPLLAIYLGFVLTITVLGRDMLPERKMEPIPFWTYRKIMAGQSELGYEIFWNIVLFIPLGAMLEHLFHRWPMPVLISFLFSAAIEVSQLATQRGWFELDDMFHNTLGAVIGLLAYGLVRKIIIKMKN